MTSVEELGTAGGRMCGHVAAALCKYVVMPCPKNLGEKGRHVGNTDMSDFWKAREALAGVGVMHVEPDRIGRSFHVFSMDAEDMPQYLASRIVEEDPSAFALLVAYLRIACCYGELLSDERDWFSPPSRYAAAMHWLAKCGYAEQRADAVRWTEKIGPAMRASGNWTEENASTTTLGRAQLEAECEQVWHAMPDTLRQAIKSSRITMLELTRALSLGWKDGTWRSYKLDEPFRLRGQLHLAKALMERARLDG